MANQRQRIVWPDVAKGISLLGVVQLHAALFSDTLYTVNGAFTGYLMPLRMGLFFLVSGMFAHKLRHISFGTVFRQRLWNWLIPYCLWIPIVWSVRYFIGDAEIEPELSSSPLVEYLFPANGMWFLFALSFATIFVWATKRFRLSVVLALSLAVSLGLSLLDPHWTYARLVQYLPFFVIGLYFRHLLINIEHVFDRGVLASGRRLAAFIGAVIVALVGYYISLRIHLDGVNPMQFMGENLTSLANQINVTLVYLLALPFGVLLALVLSKIGPLSKALSWYGRHTLPIYLTNECFAWIVKAVWDRVFVDINIPRDLFSVLVLVLTLLLCHGAVWISTKKYIRWFFYPPKFDSVVGRLVGAKRS